METNRILINDESDYFELPEEIRNRVSERQWRWMGDLGRQRIIENKHGSAYPDQLD